jgi:hypothetical protein
MLGFARRGRHRITNRMLDAAQTRAGIEPA